jgi:hypothetical protein
MANQPYDIDAAMKTFNSIAASGKIKDVKDMWPIVEDCLQRQPERMLFELGLTLKNVALWRFEEVASFIAEQLSARPGGATHVTSARQALKEEINNASQNGLQTLIPQWTAVQRSLDKLAVASAGRGTSRALVPQIP